MRLLCTGDLHLGAGSDYGREPGERLREQERVWLQIVELANDQDVDAILFAGDAWERRRPTPSELMAFGRGLHEARCPVLAIAGNHDVEAFDRPTGYDVWFGHRLKYAAAPVVVAIGDCSVVCLPWTPVANLVARNGGGDRDELNARAAELLLDTARELRSQIPDGRPAILLLHWSVSGASLPTGLPTDTLREPVIPLSELEELGFDAVVCGHIHVGSAFGSTPGKPVLYVGSPMPLNFAEGGYEHGVWILDVAVGSSGAEFVPISSRPFVTLDHDYGHYHPDSDLPSFEFENVQDAIVKVRYKATADQGRRIDHAKIRQALLDAGAHRVYAIEATIERPQRARVEGLDEGLSPRAAMQAYVDANEIDEQTADIMQSRTVTYLEGVAA